MKQFIDKIKNKKDLTFEESKAAFELLMDGKANEQEIFDFLTLLSTKGESSGEIAGGVFVLRNKSKRVNVENCVDTCGTGGDGMNTLNISTASALLLASMGVKVAKHGNKALLPCFATLTPILASSNADAVDILSVFIPSPPVPHVSTQFSTFTLLDLFLSTKTPPAISPEDSPLVDKSVKKSKISCSFALPSINNSKAALLSSKVRSFLFLILSINCFIDFRF